MVKKKIVSVVLNGKRRFYEIKDDRLFDLLSSQTKAVENSEIRILNSKIVNTIRLGATMLNPRFGVIRNPLRDTLTSFMFADYHTHIPVASVIQGVIMDLGGTDSSQIYHAMGLDLDTASGRNLRSASHLGKQVQAANKFQREMKGGIIKVVAGALSHSEVGPRLMEFQGAYNHWIDSTGDNEAAAIMAGLASGDMTVNFRRSGKQGARVSEYVLYANAGIQSLDKFLREVGAVEALPWEKQQDRGKRLARTLLRAGVGITAQALIAYFLHRDEEWWKEMPPAEKWRYFHYKIGSHKARIPLPFEPGMFFGGVARRNVRRTQNTGVYS